MLRTSANRVVWAQTRAYRSRTERYANLVTEMEGKPRLDLMAKLPWEMHRVVGVSFEGRQELLAELAPNDPVACVREPDNEYDPRAVAVRTLEGRGLGYIARTDTQAFLHDVAFGAVASVGVGEKGLFGATIAVRPSLPGVEVYAFPDSVKQYAGDLGLSGEAWEAVAAREHQAAQGRCRLTGTPATGVFPRWWFDDGARVLRLAGFALLSPAAVAVQRLLASGGPQPGLEGLLRSWNGWSEGDSARYLAAVTALQRRRSEQPWTVDLGLLAQLGIPLPDL